MRDGSLGLLSDLAHVPYYDRLVIKIMEQNPSYENRNTLDG